MIDINLIQYKYIESNTHRRVNPTLIGLARAILKLEQFNAFKNYCYKLIKNNIYFFFVFSTASSKISIINSVNVLFCFIAIILRSFLRSTGKFKEVFFTSLLSLLFILSLMEYINFIIYKYFFIVLHKFNIIGSM